ncbi:MAG: hypothetical protein ACXAEF_05020 [Candidatus Thorarchaeota archaeon]
MTIQRVGLSKKAIASITMVVIAISSVGVTLYLISLQDYTSEVSVLNIGTTEFDSGRIQIFMILSPNDLQVKMTAIHCTPMIDNLSMVNNGTGISALDDWVTGYVTYDIFGDFLEGTSYQFKFDMVDSEGGTRSTYINVSYTLENET